MVPRSPPRLHSRSHSMRITRRWSASGPAYGLRRRSRLCWRRPGQRRRASGRADRGADVAPPSVRGGGPRRAARARPRGVQPRRILRGARAVGGRLARPRRRRARVRPGPDPRSPPAFITCSATARAPPRASSPAAQASCRVPPRPSCRSPPSSATSPTSSPRSTPPAPPRPIPPPSASDIRSPRPAKPLIPSPRGAGGASG